jgi:hypothetical protein
MNTDGFTIFGCLVVINLKIKFLFACSYKKKQVLIFFRKIVSAFR